MIGSNPATMSISEREELTQHLLAVCNEMRLAVTIGYATPNSPRTVTIVSPFDPAALSLALAARVAVMFGAKVGP